MLGRKGVSVTLDILFDKKDCFHLMGLQYLTDRAELRRDRGKVFDEIKERKITAEQVEASEFYEKISISAAPFFRRTKGIIQRIRHHGPCCIKKKSGFQLVSRLSYMTD